VRIPRLHQVSWRIRPLQPFSGRLTVNGDSSHIDIPWPASQRIRTILDRLVLRDLLDFRIARAPAHPPLRCRNRDCRSLRPLSHRRRETPVILISIDTLRADHLSAYGYTKIHTPNIDSLAAGGTIYQRVDSQIPLTLPSHTVLMTSIYPFQNRVEANAEIVPPGSVTLASILRANGYRTAAFIAA